MLYDGLYDRWLRDTIGTLLLEHGFRLTSEPSRCFDPDASFTFQRDDVAIRVVVGTNIISWVLIGKPWGDTVVSGIRLDQLLKKRRRSSRRINLSRSEEERAAAIAEALRKHCSDVLSGKLPRELLPKTRTPRSKRAGQRTTSTVGAKPQSRGTVRPSSKPARRTPSRPKPPR